MMHGTINMIFYILYVEGVLFVRNLGMGYRMDGAWDMVVTSSFF